MIDKPFVSDYVKLGLTREEAIEEGRQLAGPNADHDRIRRAMAYAAWDYDGRPPSSRDQHEEMGVGTPDIASFLERQRIWDKRGEQA